MLFVVKICSRGKERCWLGVQRLWFRDHIAHE